jgi:hypothetical protein
MTLPDRHAATCTARHDRSRALVAFAAALVAIAGLIAVAPARAAGPPCSIASAKRVKSALGVTIVGPPSVTTNGPVTVCQFRTANSGLLVRFETHASQSLFAFGRKSFGQHGAPTKTVSGIGTKAYSSSLQGSNTLVVLKNTTELLVTSSISLTKLEALARLILPSL